MVSSQIMLLAFYFNVGNIQKQSPTGVLKKDFLKNLANFTRKRLFRSHFLSSCRLRPCSFIEKEIPTQVFSCEYCEISQNNFLQNTALKTASDIDRCLKKITFQRLKIHGRSYLSYDYRYPKQKFYRFYKNLYQ